MFDAKPKAIPQKFEEEKVAKQEVKPEVIKPKVENKP